MPGSTSSIVGLIEDIILCASAWVGGATRRASAKIRNQIIFVIPRMTAQRRASEFVLDVGLRPVRATGGFGVPASFLVFIFYDFCVSRHGLLFSCRLGGGQSISVCWKGFREDAVHFVGPPTIVLDNLVRHFCHWEETL